MVNFSKNWNNKLSWGIIPTVRLYTQEKFEYYKQQIGKAMPIMLNREKICKGSLYLIQREELGKIAHNLKRLDTGLEPEEFDKLIERYYSKKPEWKGDRTEMMILFFLRIKEGDADATGKN